MDFPQFIIENYTFKCLFFINAWFLVDYDYLILCFFGFSLFQKNKGLSVNDSSK